MPRKRQSRSGASTSSSATREDWLREVASSMSGWFGDLGFPLPDFEVRSGFPSVGRRSANITESWTEDDGASYVIFVRPDRSEEIMVAAALAFQLCRIAVGQQDSHGYLFRHLAISIGLRGKKTESPPGALFKELIKPVLKRAGPMPSPEITPTHKEQKASQTTRLIKVSCPECGYVARVARKWLEDVGPPHCPVHGQMKQGG